jgi:hypothetical protein
VCALLAIGSFLIPIATLVLSAYIGTKVASGGDTATTIGAGLGAFLLTGLSVITGFFFGIVFAFAAYLLLRN